MGSVEMGEGRALEAAVEAREAGLVKHVGATGHNWTIAAMRNNQSTTSIFGL